MGNSTSSGNHSEQQIENLREALKQVIYQNEMLLRWVNGAVLTVDSSGNIVEANDVALQSLGWEKDDLIGLQGHETFQHTTDEGGEYPWEFSPVFAAIEDGSSHHVDGDLFWKKDGSSFVADYMVSPIRDENNDISGATIIFRNLTELRMQEAKRIHGMKLESIGELAAGIAHEINTPIQFIGTNVAFLKDAFADISELLEVYDGFQKTVLAGEDTGEMLEKLKACEEEVELEYLKEEVPEAFEQTAQGVDRVTKLVQGLKGFAHSSDSQVKSPADINEIIENTLIVCKNAYKYVAECELKLGDLPDVEVLHDDIGQVFLNLIVNAAQAIEEVRKGSGGMGRITISSRCEDNYVVITVGDDGGGIPEQIKERVFDPFFTTKEVGRGSGQGLAICRTIVEERHQGEIGVTSTEGKGSVFTVKLPIGRG